MTKVILFKDGSKKFLDEKEAKLFDEWLFPSQGRAELEFVLNDGGKKSIFYAHDIRRYLDMEEYYKQYPQEKPEMPRDTYKKELLQPSVMSNPARLARSKRGAKQMLEGFDAAIKRIHGSYKNVSQGTRELRKRLVKAVESYK